MALALVAERREPSGVRAPFPHCCGPFSPGSLRCTAKVSAIGLTPIGSPVNSRLIVGEEILDTRDLIPLGTLQAELASQQSFEYLRYALSFE